MNLRPLLWLSIIALPSLSFVSAQEACIQVVQPAVSPHGVCQEFANPCVVPADWKSVPSCDIVNQRTREKKTLENRMDNRIVLMRAVWDKKKEEQKQIENNAPNQNFNRIGSGALTRSARNKRLPTGSPASTDGVRTFTNKDYGSDVAKRYSLRGGYQRAGDTTTEERKARRANRPAMMSGTEVKRSGNLKTTIKWDVLSRQFTTPKGYGPNPYHLRADHSASQKAHRAARNQEIEVSERMLSRSRVYRGDRMDGNLDSSSLLEKGLIKGQENGE